MAELASGAVSTLLGVIRNEAALLGGVQDDVQFIKEEMESMNSFLLHLARTAPHDGEHDEQVQTWMGQVRLLAHDCNNCIDLYLSRRNPDIQLPKRGPWRRLLWACWFLQKILAQRRAADQLRSLKERARDVGERRMRYNVMVPEKKTTAEDKEHNGDDQLAAAEHADRMDFGTLDDYLEAKLVHWIAQAHETNGGSMIPSVSIIVAPDADQDADPIAHEALAFVRTEKHFKLSVLVDIPSVHLDHLPLRPKGILYYILRELEQSQSQQDGEGTDHDQGAEVDPQFLEWKRKYHIYNEKKQVLEGIKTNIRAMKLYEKIEEIKKELEEGKSDKLLQWSLKKQMKDYENTKMKAKISEKNLGVLLLLLLKSATAALDGQDQVKTKDKPTLAPWYDDIIDETSKKLQEHIEKGGGREEEEAAAAEDDDDDDDEEYDDDDEDDEDEDDEEGKNEEAAAAGDKGPILLNSYQYANILREVFPKISNSKRQHDQEQDQDITISTTPTLGEDQIKQIVEKVKLEILRELLPAGTSHNSKSLQAQVEDSLAAGQATNAIASTLGENPPRAEESDKKHAVIVQVTIEKEDEGQDSWAAGQVTTLTSTTGEDPRRKGHKKKREGKSNSQDQKLDQIVQETKEKMEELIRKINGQLKIRRIMDKIKNILKNESAVIILKIDGPMIHGFPWEETRNALSLLDCIAGAVIVTTPSGTQWINSNEYCYPQQQEPINYSLVGFYHDNVLEHTSQMMDEEIIHNILDSCKPHEYCMKIFAHALYAKPKRHKDLEKLQIALQKVSPNSPSSSIAKKLFKFSFNDLPKEHKSCLLYLAIFPPEHKIRRSTLIGRWVAEGLITTEDWLWSNSVREAEKCFDALIRLLLVCPADISSTGEVKSCMVDSIIHGFITNIAEKQHIMEARLSHHLAHHFSIYNDLRLRGSDTIINFLDKLSISAPLLKVLDLEGCCQFKNNQHYIKNICSKILLLKYLSLRGTDVTQLPSEINNLQELEVLDIRQTKVPPKATRHVRLLRLKRLLAGDPCLSDTDVPSVQVPEKIENMEHMEVLSTVKPLNSQDLRDIGTLSHLRKLGLVIEDKVSHLRALLQSISDLHKSLRSLSITLRPATKNQGAPYNRGFSFLRNTTSRSLPSTVIDYNLKDPPKLLESLSINGTTQKVPLLQKLLGKDGKELAKVTLSNTSLKKDDLEVLAKLPKLRCFRLRHISCTKIKLTFNGDEFPNLKYFLFKGFSMTDISFQAEATHGLDEIVLSFNIDELNKNSTSTNTIPSLLPSPPPLEHEMNTTTNTIATTTGVDGFPTQEQHMSNNTTTAATAITEANGLPKLEQESNNNNNHTAPATVVDSLQKLEEQKPNKSITTINTTTVFAATTTGVESLPKQDGHELHTTTTTITSSSTNKMLLSLLDSNAKQITKVTLQGTLLKKGGLQNLTKKLKLRRLVLLENSYVESKLTFNEDDFPKLNILIVNCSNITEISFTSRSAPKLEKIIWTFTKDKKDYYSLSGINNLPKLKDFEFDGEAVPPQVQNALNEHRNKPIPKYNKPEMQEQVESTLEVDAVSCFPSCWKKKD